MIDKGWCVSRDFFSFLLLILIFEMSFQYVFETFSLNFLNHRTLYANSSVCYLFYNRKILLVFVIRNLIRFYKYFLVFILWLYLLTYILFTHLCKMNIMGKLCKRNPHPFFPSSSFPRTSCAFLLSLCSNSVECLVHLYSSNDEMNFKANIIRRWKRDGEWSREFKGKISNIFKNILNVIYPKIRLRFVIHLCFFFVGGIEASIRIRLSAVIFS